ncbi:hypothetical protein KJ678_04330 [Patescibacteria group bacterium]|nr:hypothetical protein [Patescibacteria group bacterium]
MKDQTNIGNQNTQQNIQNPMSQTVKAPKKSKINYWIIYTVPLLFILLIVGLWFILNSKNRIPSDKLPVTNNKKQAADKLIPSSYIFQTFVRGNVCAYRIGSDPNTIDPFCKYWQVNPITKIIDELPVNHPYFKQIYAEQQKAYEGIQRGVCTDSKSEEICIKVASQDNDNKFLYTIDFENNLPTSAWIRTVDTNNKEKIIEDIKSTGCEGQISSWSENSGDILFTTQWYNTPKSQSGEMLKSLCIYNYKTGNVIYKKLLPVDTYNLHKDDMINGRVYLDNIIIDYRNNYEDNLPVIENKEVIYDEYGKLFRNGLILVKSETPDAFYIQQYDINTKKLSSQTIISRDHGVDDNNPSQRDSLRFVTISKDRTHIIFERMPSNNRNTTSMSSCFYDFDLSSSKIQKIVCSYQFQELYPNTEPSNFDQFIYVDFLDWYEIAKDTTIPIDADKDIMKECEDCPQFSPFYPDWCKNGIIVAPNKNINREKNCYCYGPPSCNLK